MRLAIILGFWMFVAAGPLSAASKQVAPFQLTDYRGTEFSLTELTNGKVLVVLFLGTECPMVKSYSPRLSELAKRYEGKGVNFIGIDSNAQDSLADINTFAKEYLVPFPILKDPDAKVADGFGAKRTPEAFIVDSDRVIRYHGRIDDQFAPGVQRSKPTRDDLVEAIEEVLAKKNVSVDSTPALGCFIGRVNKETASGGVTYASHVRHIIGQRCLECHRSGEIGPMPLSNYEEVAPWGETIAEVVSQRRMPPWFADPKFGKFLHDPRLTDDEIQTIDTWVKNGCPAGDDSKSAGDVPQFTDGWLMREKPDIVYYMSDKPYQVPASGDIDYVYYEVDPGFKEDTWIYGSEARPGNRSVVHHILIFVKRPGRWYPEGLPGELISAYAPGMKPTVGADDSMALLVPKGSKFVMQMHYTANGRPQEDRSYFGVKLCTDPSKIKWEVKPGMAINLFFNIPPNNDNYRVPALFTFPEDSLLLGVNPHMHKRGKSFVYEAVYPDGKRETIMNCPKFDFNWQLGYQYETPLVMKKGTKLACTAYFDNSVNNPSNPDPNRKVGFGEQTWDEMMIGWLFYAVKRQPEGTNQAQVPRTLSILQ